MRNGIRFITVALFALCTQAQAETALGEINIQLYGNIVDFTCVAEGRQRQNRHAGHLAHETAQHHREPHAAHAVYAEADRLSAGAASITFSGKADGSNNGLLALNDASTASRVAVEIRDADKTRLDLQQASQPVTVDAQGNATLSFYANYIATADNPQPGKADADATFMINYN
jgi:minor fimbrial subunit